MAKIKVELDSFVYPMPVILVGAMVDDKPNFLAIGWVSRVSFKPPLVAFAIARNHYTTPAIIENRQFSLNVPSASLVEKTDLCGILSGHKNDKSSLFETFSGSLENAPLIAECPFSLECSLYDVLDFSEGHVIVGEVVSAYSDDEFLTDGKVDPLKVDPFVLLTPTNAYFKVGDKIGDAWKCGLSKKHLAPDK